MQSVTIYTTPTCGYCKAAKAFLNEHNITYTEKDVSADIHARQEMISKSGQMGVPLIEIDGQLVLGFDESELRAALSIAN